MLFWIAVWVRGSKGDGDGADMGSTDGDARGKGLDNIAGIGKIIGEVFGLLGNEVCGLLGKVMVSAGV